MSESLSYRFAGDSPVEHESKRVCSVFDVSLIVKRRCQGVGTAFICICEADAVASVFCLDVYVGCWIDCRPCKSRGSRRRCFHGSAYKFIITPEYYRTGGVGRGEYRFLRGLFGIGKESFGMCVAYIGDYDSVGTYTCGKRPHLSRTRYACLDYAESCGRIEFPHRERNTDLGIIAAGRPGDVGQRFHKLENPFLESGFSATARYGEEMARKIGTPGGCFLKCRYCVGND